MSFFLDEGGQQSEQIELFIFITRFFSDKKTEEIGKKTSSKRAKVCEPEEN